MRLKLTTKSVSMLESKTKIYKVWDTEIKGFFLRVLPSGTKTYCLHYRHKGKGRDYTIAKSGNVTCSIAREIAKVKTGQLARGIDIQAEKKLERRIAEASKFQTLGGFITNKYSPWVSTQRKTGSSSIRRINYNFPHLMAREMSQIKAWDIQKWRTEALKSGKKSSSLNRDLVALKSCLSKAVEWEILENNPLASVKPLRLDNLGKARYLTQAEETELRSALDKREQAIRSERLSANEWRKARGYKLMHDFSDCSFVDHLKPMVLLAMNTGMRRGELFDLKWPSINLKGAILTIEGKTSKSGNTRHIPLNNEALGALIAWRNQTDTAELVFPNPNTGKRFDNISKSWNGVLKLSGLKDFRFHDLRHHFASKLVMAGVDLNTVRELLGHSELTMTLRYAHLAPEHKVAAVSLLDNSNKR